MFREHNESYENTVANTNQSSSIGLDLSSYKEFVSKQQPANAEQQNSPETLSFSGVDIYSANSNNKWGDNQTAFSHNGFRHEGFKHERQECSKNEQLSPGQSSGPEQNTYQPQGGRHCRDNDIPNDQSLPQTDNNNPGDQSKQPDHPSDGHHHHGDGPTDQQIQQLQEELQKLEQAFAQLLEYLKQHNGNLPQPGEQPSPVPNAPTPSVPQPTPAPEAPPSPIPPYIPTPEVPPTPVPTPIPTPEVPQKPGQTPDVPPEANPDKPASGSDAENAALHKLVRAHGSATAQDIELINKQLDKLPEAQKKELLRDNIRIELYGTTAEDPNGVDGAAAYTDGKKIVTYMDSGMAEEAFRHEVFHTYDLNSPEGGLVTNNAQYRNLLQQEINNLTPAQYNQFKPILADEPLIPTKFGSTPIGDIAAEQYAGLTGPTQTRFADMMNQWLPKSSAYLKQLCQIA